MIAKLKRKPPKSTGPKGDLDSRRWVIITLRNNGANESQFPLPVTVNAQRIAFDRDEPVIAPAYYLDTIDNCILPKYEQINNSPNQNAAPGEVRNQDDARMVEIKYNVEVTEIDEKWQNVESIIDFVRLVNSEDCPIEMTDFQNRLRLGQMSFNSLNYDWSNQVQAQSKSKSGPKKQSADNNAG